jgi:hypothetical protein
VNLRPDLRIKGPINDPSAYPGHSNQERMYTLLQQLAGGSGPWMQQPGGVVDLRHNPMGQFIQRLMMSNDEVAQGIWESNESGAGVGDIFGIGPEAARVRETAAQLKQRWPRW